MKAFYSNVFKNYFLMTASMFAGEILFKYLAHLPILDWSLLRIFVGISVISLIASALFSFFGRIIGNVLSNIFAFIIALYGIIQIASFNYFGTILSINLKGQFSSITDYLPDFVRAFNWKYWLIAVPPVLMLLFYLFFDHRIKVLERNDEIDFADKFDSVERKKMNDEIIKKKRRKQIINSKINAVVFAAIFAGAYYFLLSASFMNNQMYLKDAKDLFFNTDIPNVTIGQFGYTGYGVLDIKSLIIKNPKLSFSPYDKGFEKPEQLGGGDFKRHMNDTTWDAVVKNETNGNYKRLNNYYISQEITDKNDYTALFDNKNVVFIMMNSTNDAVLNPQFFPNIYKMYNEGWSWVNNYNLRDICAGGDAEAIAMLSIYPSNTKCTVNAYKNNVYPESLLNLFVNDRYTTASFHDYTDQYYQRKTYHPNLGSQHYYGVEELAIPFDNSYQEWPSDVELAEKVLEFTAEQKKFAVLISTDSANQPYTVSSVLADKNLELFSNTNYNTSLKRYMSKLKDLDDAVGVLVEGLRNQGKLDDTIFVLFSSHYPYGLTKTGLNAALNYDILPEFEMERSPLIIYNVNLLAVQRTEYTSIINVAPTVANLFNLNYDPRLYAGEDLFSKTYEDRVIFADGSWKDKKAFYNASIPSITYVNPGDTYSKDELKEINSEVREKIEMSNLALRVNYFNYLAEARERERVAMIEEDEAS